ncbi:YdeI/OmpD-associated family protein [Echinicola salinicaeni]|uniref:YdeI/OmpD-associated family protein n=1 Tax=Echinicola salinicaeni TaxID=2762757 RepID=UPI001E6078B2|nr:YdeI/OmpD-associated family protein [Echinicola salinicaeni]
MMKIISFEADLENFHSKLWQYHIPVPAEIADQFIDKDNRRVICHLGNTSFKAALMKTKEYWFILINQKIREELNLNEGDTISLKLEKDHSEYGHEMPEELQVLLDQDEEGNGYFKSLTMGKQRSLIYIVIKVKNSHSRLNKSLAIVDHLKEVQGKLDFKLLNEKIKYYNNLDKPLK